MKTLSIWIAFLLDYRKRIKVLGVDVYTLLNRLVVILRFTIVGEFDGIGDSSMINDLLSEIRIDFWRDIGLIINDEKLFDRVTANYGYHEIMYQNIDHFFIETNDDDFIKPKRKTTFEEIYDFYCLDQHIKNVMMISLQLFEQSFKVALAETALIENGKNFTRNLNPRTIHQRRFLNEKYQLKDGRVIHRGDVKARMRHIKQNYLEPYEGYTEAHGEAGIGLIIKEMSFGVATNYFFLMPIKAKKIVLTRVFKEKITLRQFEEWLNEIRYFQRRAAHNFSLLIIKEKRQFLYKLVLNNLHQLANQEPCELAEERINKIVQNYLTKYPIEKDFLNKVFMEKKD